MSALTIAEVKFKEDYLMSVLLDDGNEVIYDMKPRLVTARFRDLEDWKIFSGGKIVNANKAVKWNQNTEMTIEEIMLKAKKC